jgi:hypothetical protein
MESDCSSVCDPSYSSGELPPPTKYSRKSAKAYPPQALRSSQDSKKALEFLLAYKATITSKCRKEGSFKYYQSPPAVSDEWLLELQKMN